jgi:DNA-binding MarR family transcriptional regulator
MSIGFEIKEVAILIKRVFDKKTLSQKDLNSENRAKITIMQGHIMEYIYSHENHKCTQSEIEKTFKRRRSTITGMLKLMEKNDLITREYSKKDARVKMVTLTKRAESMHKQAMQQMEDFNEYLESGLTPEEVETFHNIMGKIKHNLEEFDNAE